MAQKDAVRAAVIKAGVPVGKLGDFKAHILDREALAFDMTSPPNCRLSLLSENPATNPSPCMALLLERADDASWSVVRFGSGRAFPGKARAWTLGNPDELISLE
jgi:hypothetical protein